MSYGKNKIHQRMKKRTCVKEGLLANFTKKDKNSQNMCGVDCGGIAYS